MTDDLLEPSVTANRPPAGKKPWRVQSQVWVAFFGGIMAVTAIALLNAQRLGVDRRRRWLMAAAGFVALLILGALWMRQPLARDFATFTREARDMRIYGRVIAVVLFLLLAALQKGAESHYQVFAKDGPAPLWTAGVTASVVFGTIQPLLLASIAWMVRR